MIITQTAATIAILAAVIAVVAAQYVDHYTREYNWIDYLGATAMHITIISGVVSILAFIWGL